MKLEDLSFDNCVIIGFSRDAMRGSLTLTFEAFDAKCADPAVAIYVLECSGVQNDALQFSGEFLTDLESSYDQAAHDQRANEIHQLRRDASGNIHIEADMVKGHFYCQKYRIFRVVEIGASVGA